MYWQRKRHLELLSGSVEVVKMKPLSSGLNLWWFLTPFSFARVYDRAIKIQYFVVWATNSPILLKIKQKTPCIFLKYIYFRNWQSNYIWSLEQTYSSWFCFWGWAAALVRKVPLVHLVGASEVEIGWSWLVSSI